MDHFGIGVAILGSARIYMQSARRTGRTASLVESVKDGDRIVFTCAKEAERVKRLLLDRDVKVSCIVIPTHDPYRLAEHGRSIGRTLFDHSWVEQFYLSSIEHAQKQIDIMERTSSEINDGQFNPRIKFEIDRWEV